MPTILVTGANRGLGLALCEAFAADGWSVVAAARDVAHIPPIDGDVTALALDVTDGDSVAAAAALLAGRPIDVLCNNAGVFGQRDDEWGHFDLDGIDYDSWRGAFEVNVLGPLRVTTALAANLLAGEKKILCQISSRMGSIAKAETGGAASFRVTKSALNMLNRCLSHALADKGVTSVVLHPGWVRTDMGGADAPLDPATSAAGLKRVIEGLGPADTGRFLSWRGEEIPW